MNNSSQEQVWVEAEHHARELERFFTNEYSCAVCRNLILNTLLEKGIYAQGQELNGAWSRFTRQVFDDVVVKGKNFRQDEKNIKNLKLT